MSHLSGYSGDAISEFANAILAEYEELFSRNPLRALPEFVVEDAGESGLPSLDSPFLHRVYTDSSFSPLPSRFGVRRERERIFLDKAFESVFEGLLRREVLALFVPAKFLTELVFDLLNFYCALPLEEPTRTLWENLTLGATKEYKTEHAFSPVKVNTHFNFTPEIGRLFERMLEKFIALDSIIREEAAGDAAIFLAWSIGTHPNNLNYSPTDAVFAKLVFECFADEHRHPGVPQLEAQGSNFSREEIRALAERFDSLPFSPSSFYNPSAFGAEFCHILFEVPPTVSPYAVRQLVYCPFFCLSLSQLLGCPQPTFIGTYFLFEDNLAEFRRHLAQLKKRGALLDFHVFRLRISCDLVNFQKLFALPEKGARAHLPEMVIHSDFLEAIQGGSDLGERWKRSWLIQQMLPLYQLRSTIHGALTSLDHGRNLQSFRELLFLALVRF
ncbi:MAG TPA: hypothetical protein VKK79_06490, partial [Candidatus Lokiarchaeia archaeon]|nr:hypothetical protein [Candidatus Lokiarchaeia archaeon]